MSRVIVAALAALVLVLPAAAGAAEGGPTFPEVRWSFSGIFGTFDRRQLRRGFQVYNEVCSGCHSLRLVAYRNLAEIGFDADTIKEIAAEQEVPGEPNDEGEPTTRPALPSDHFVPLTPTSRRRGPPTTGRCPPISR